ncbi:histidine phosphatase family protein [Sedimentibacter hydroxybenzoicus DSM 7310]|uniref:Histidine phosphatase family protein n=1 Tax=Sedimentibacter hydroxybenzoicus DSM 7310 TaxID=1123245 RepID=A0A974BLD9_SEDHY|nr:histidine phosphatase family protein [Sedimentibacter hydroxybenzoicus]NYB75222.1 histidine phosphatase family protein [Sedimentibacter hydroxybenzoicus DSM 7310]
MTEVYFVRHAEPNYMNHDDELRELTEKGLTDRMLVTDFLKDKNIDAVLSSPYKRSVDTVKDFADKYGHQVVIVSGFKERKIDSVWIDDFTAFSQRQWMDFDYKLTDGETLREVQNRNIDALKWTLNKYRNKRIVIGSHGTALSTIINYYDTSFGYDSFNNIKEIMPWIVKFTFDEECLQSIEMFDLFAK